MAKRAMHHVAERVEKRASPILDAIDAHWKKAAGFVHRDATVEDQVVVTRQIHRALLLNIPHLIPQRLALKERSRNWAMHSSSSGESARDRSSRWSADAGRASRNVRRQSARSNPAYRSDAKDCDARVENPDFGESSDFRA